jgi:hypothetical protein
MSSKRARSFDNAGGRSNRPKGNSSTHQKAKISSVSSSVQKSGQEILTKSGSSAKQKKKFLISKPLTSFGITTIKPNEYKKGLKILLDDSIYQKKN